MSKLSCVPSVPHLASAGKTVSQTSRSWTVHSLPALRPYSSRPSCDRWNMSSGWTAIYRIPRQLVYGELEAGKRKQGRLRKQYKDTVKGNLQWCGIQPKEVEAAASDRSHWCSLTHTASTRFENDRRQSLITAYEQRHRACSADITITEFQCPTCSILCTSRLGLQSHHRIHR